MIHLVATNLTKVLRDTAKNKSNYLVSVVDITNKVTVQAFFPDQKLDSIPADFQLKKIKFKNQKVLKLNAGDKLLIAIPKSSAIGDPKKQTFWIYDEELGWGKINGGYAKKLIENAEVSLSKIYKILDVKKKESKDELKQVSEQFDKELDDALEFLVKELSKVGGRVRPSKTEKSISIEWSDEEGKLPSISVYGSLNWNGYFRLTVSSSSSYLYEAEKPEQVSEAEKRADLYVKVIKNVNDAIKQFNKKYLPELNKLGTRIFELYRNR